MSKMGDLSAILDEMVECGNTLIRTATALKDFYSSTEDTKKEPETVKEETNAPVSETKTYSKEDVRALLSQKASEADGKYKVAVKELVKKYADGGTLKDIQPENYAALVAELEVIANG